MEAALASLAAEAEDAIHLGYNILIVSDRKVAADLMPIPALLATAAVHQHLVRKGLRTSTGLVVETGIGARGPSLRAPRRLWRRGDSSVSRAGDARRARLDQRRRVLRRRMRRSISSRRSTRDCTR
jgi:hypothetical protein